MATVETFFIDVSTGETIAQVAMPAERLPQSFALNTTMHIGDEDWQVISAEPATAEEFIQTGKLVLKLQKVVREPEIVKMPVDNILFSLPTICAEIPRTLAGSTKLGKAIFALHEDDWRQIEFVSRSFRNTISSELKAIQRIYRKESVDNGEFRAFKAIHVRKQIRVPIQEEIRLNQLLSLFSPAPFEYDGISFVQTNSLLEGGFAFKVAAVLFYGQQSEGIVQALGIKVVEQPAGGNKKLASSLHPLMAKYDVYLVDWCRLRVLEAGADITMIEKFLER